MRLKPQKKVSLATGTAEQRTERRILVLSAVACLVIGGVALVFAHISESQAILLDGLFNLSYFATGLFTLKVASLLQRGDDERFPYGYSFFEPLVNGVKGLLVLGVTVMAFWGAVNALLSGGRAIGAGPAIAYGVFASVAGAALAFVTHRASKKISSPLIQADAENWLVNAAISSAVLLAFIGIFLIRGTALEPLAPYVDPALVLIVVVISISVPVRMAWQALMGLLNRAPSSDIVAQVRAVIEEAVADLPVKELYVRVVQPGRTRMILTHIVLPEDYQVGSLSHLDTVRRRTHEALRARHLDSVLDMVFTADSSWGAPIAEGGQSPYNASTR